LYNNFVFTNLFLKCFQTVEERTEAIMQVNQEGQNVLHLLIASGSESIANHFQAFTSMAPLLVDLVDNYGMHPLLYACKIGNLPALNICIRSGCSNNFVDKENRNCLHLAVELQGSQALPFVESLLHFGFTREDIHAKNKMNQTPLARTILLMFRDTNERIKIASQLMGFGASLENCVSQDNILWEACRAGAFRAAQFVLQTKQASEFVHRIDETGQTVFHIAVQHGEVEILRILLHFLGPETSFLLKKKSNGENVAHVAVQSPKGQASLELLLATRVDFETNNEGETILDIAIKYNVTPITEYLKKKVAHTSVSPTTASTPRKEVSRKESSQLRDLLERKRSQNESK